MKTVIKTALILLVVGMCFMGCAKLSEDVWVERIPRPQIDVDTISVPPWDFIPQPDIPTGK